MMVDASGVLNTCWPLKAKCSSLVSALKPSEVAKLPLPPMLRRTKFFGKKVEDSDSAGIDVHAKRRAIGSNQQSLQQHGACGDEGRESSNSSLR